MKLTDLQKQAINKMDAEMATETLHECAERLGLVPVDEYAKIHGMRNRTVYDHIQKGKIQKIDFCGSVLIPINRE